MWRPRSRSTARRMMVIVAIAAIVMALVPNAIRRGPWASRYRILAAGHKAGALSTVPSVTDGAGRELLSAEEVAELEPERLAYHAALSQKYDRAANRPWSTIPPDPPDPIVAKIIKLGRPVKGLTIRSSKQVFCTEW
jgi:hypothetical protein